MFDKSLRVGDAIAMATTTLDESDSAEVSRRSRADATLLLQHVMDVPQAEILAYRERPLTREQIHRYRVLTEQRRRGMPMQYILGEQEFFGLPFHVTKDVLIPRPETEHLVEAAIERLHDLPTPRIVDVGTGSGAIAVALAYALPHCEVVALDISDAALVVARENAARNGVAERVRFVQSDLLAAVSGEQFDAVVSNPPYVAERERKTLPVEVREFEPGIALFAGPTGLEIYQRLIVEAGQTLDLGGWLLMEIGFGQRDAIAKMLVGWDGVEFVDDLQGIPRVACARKFAGE